MARVTSLGINIFSHWNGRGMRRARRNLNQFGDGLNDTQKDANRLTRSINKMDGSNKMLARSLRRPTRDVRRLGNAMGDTNRDTNRFRRTLRALGRGIAAPFRGIGRLRRSFHELGDSLHSSQRRTRAFMGVWRMLGKRMAVVGAIALIPIIAQLARVGAGLLAMSAAAAIGFGGFAALALLASRRAFQLAEENKKLSKSQRAHVDSVNALRRAWGKFADSKVGGKLLVPINIVIKAITRNMGKLKPLVNAIAPIFRRIARAFANWMDRASGFRRFVNHMKKHGVPIMRNLAAASRSVLKFLGRVFRDSLPLAKKLSKRIREGARALAKWAAKGGFRKWLNHTKKNSPEVRKFFRQLRKLLPKLIKAFIELGPPMLRVATAFLKIANRLSPGQLKAIIILWLAAKPALVGFKLALWGVNAALFLFRRRSKKASGATGVLGGKSKGTGGKIGKLGAKLKSSAGRLARFAGRALAATGLVAGLRIGVMALIGVLAGPVGLIALAVGVVVALGFLAVKTGVAHDVIGAFRGAIEFLMDVIGDLGGALKAVTNGPLSAFKTAIDKGGNLIEDIGGGIADAAHALFGSGLHQAFHEVNKKAKPFNKHIKTGRNRLEGFRKQTKKSEKHTSLFGRKLNAAGKGAKKFGKNAGKSGGGLKALSKQTGLSRKELKKMGISSKDADGMLKKFGTGAVNTGKKVKNKAGKHFKNGAKNVRNSWDKATTHIRKSTRKRFDKVIHHTRAFRNKLGRQFKGIAKSIRKHFGKATESVKDNARKDFNKANKQAKQLRNGIGKNFQRVAKAIRRHWGRATESVKDSARKDFNRAQKQAKQFRNNIGKQFNRVAGAIRKHWGKATESVADNARKRFNKTIKHVKDFRKRVGNNFDKVANKIRKSWSDVLDNVKDKTKRRLNEIRKAIDGTLKRMRKSFDKTTDAIKKIWQGRLPSIFKKPVKFFVKTVYNNGLRKAWNGTFANLPGIKELKAARVPFASGGLAQRGGRVRGPGGPTSDKIPAALSSGEYVVRAKAVKDIGVDVLNRINQGVGGDMPKRGVPKSKHVVAKSVADSHFAEGGMIGSRSRHNQCSAMKWAFAGGGPVLKLAEGGFIPYPSVDINEVRKRAIAAGIKAAKKSKMLGMTAMPGFSSGNMSNSDDTSGAGGFDWGTNLYQDVAKKVGKKVLHPFMNTAFRAGNSGSLRPAGEWAEVPPTHLKQIMDQLLQYIWEHANTGCGTGGFAPFRPWRAGDGQRVGFRGVTLDKRTRAMCLASEAKLSKRMSYFQGSFSHAAASAGTHAGGGAVDVGPASFKTSGAMRASGFAAWARGGKFGSGSFAPHVHGIAVGNKNLSGPAKQQVKAFQAGRDGLAGNRPDNQPGGAVGSCSVSGGGCGVKRWAGMAQLALRLGGCPAGPGNLSKFLRLMKQESCGNPNAINRTDSNAAAGIPSQGLMQVIPPTFRSNHVKGTSNNILDPLANMAASARYIKRRYGCNIPQAPYAQGGLVTKGLPRGGHPRSLFCGGGEVVKQAMPWIFDTGGTLRPGLNVVDNRTGGPERLHRDRNGDGGGSVHVHIHGNVYTKNSREFEGMVVEAVSSAKRKGRV